MRAADSSTTLLALILAPASDVAAVDSSIAQDIASAGRLRTQSQRLAKLYQQAAMDITTQAARHQIATTISAVDGELARLAKYDRLANTQRPLARSKALWQELRGALNESYSQTSSERVNQLV
ncbi:MAG: type IV pili methyl-accepting chemotaxis transducer N-terminal domain-containing protein [Azonexus sp.]|uniref:type IV pili methyl-accepting chemotaxis transducer N-terminal domain-containing protein n=1 Tax=Azonexus sp. TaxID=1872668 RepID=UPI0028276CBB|nr:type IV pili methyl-accepting chemotaxis transducer N-terminal domain-containing protein [Azonexus sp.]MDR0775131.1 type IV pili methyl-accepting chemotaxis transducer N-terminal domain-containing protein [Azonexus sp.]